MSLTTTVLRLKVIFSSFVVWFVVFCQTVDLLSYVPVCSFSLTYVSYFCTESDLFVIRLLRTLVQNLLFWLAKGCFLQCKRASFRVQKGIYCKTVGIIRFYGSFVTISLILPSLISPSAILPPVACSLNVAFTSLGQAGKGSSVPSGAS